MEQKTICPKCGFPSIGPRIRPHNCAKRQAHPEQYGPQKKAGTIVVVQPEMDHAAMGEQLTEQYHRAVRAEPEILKFGAMIVILEARMKESDPRGSLSLGRGKKGGLRGFLRDHAPEVPIANALRYRDMVLGIATEYASLVNKTTAKQFTLPELIVAEKLPPPIEKQRAALFEKVSHESQKSWTDKVRLGGDGRRNNPGGFRPHLDILRPWLRETYPEHPEWEELLFGDLPAEVQKKFKAECDRYKKRLSKAAREEIAREAAGREWMASAPDALNQAKDQQSFIYGTPEQLKHLEDALKDLLGAVQEHGRGRKEVQPKLKAK